jgi:hypothetical protein
MALMWTAVAFAHFLAGRNDEASSWAAMALRENPTLHSAIRVAAAANAMTGLLEKAQNEMALMRQLDPTLRVSNLSDVMPFRRPEDLAKHAEALRMAANSRSHFSAINVIETPPKMSITLPRTHTDGPTTIEVEGMSPEVAAATDWVGFVKELLALYDSLKPKGNGGGKKNNCTKVTVSTPDGSTTTVETCHPA